MELNGMPDRPWANYNRGKQMTGNGLAEELRPFHVKPFVFKDGAKPIRGYALTDLQPVFDRYLAVEDGK